MSTLSLGCTDEEKAAVAAAAAAAGVTVSSYLYRKVFDKPDFVARQGRPQKRQPTPQDQELPLQAAS